MDIPSPLSLTVTSESVSSPCSMISPSLIYCSVLFSDTKKGIGILSLLYVTCPVAVVISGIMGLN